MTESVTIMSPEQPPLLLASTITVMILRSCISSNMCRDVMGLRGTQAPLDGRGSLARLLMTITRRRSKGECTCAGQ